MKLVNFNFFKKSLFELLFNLATLQSRNIHTYAVYLQNSHPTIIKLGYTKKQSHINANFTRLNYLWTS